MSVLPVVADRIAPVGRAEAAILAAEEYRRFLALARSLSDDEWTRRTDCPDWDCRQLVSHVTGITEMFSGIGQALRQTAVATKVARAEGIQRVDAITRGQVDRRRDMTPAQILDEYAVVAPKAARWRAGVPAPLRRLPLKESVGGVPETWRVGYLLDTILTRDVWMHRIDLSRASGRDLGPTADHDGRLVADVVAEWARRHGKAFDLTLLGAAGGSFTQGSGGEAIEVDAIEFCRIVSGRATGTGLLQQLVAF